MPALPSWTYWLLALLLVAGAQQWRVMDEQGERAQLQADWDKERADLAGQVAEAERKARAEEQRRQREFEGIKDEAKGEMEQAISDARDADERADGLQREVDRLRASRGATCDAIAANRGEATASAFDVLAELLKESDRLAGGYAKAADESRIRGAACEAAYDLISPKIFEN